MSLLRYLFTKSHHVKPVAGNTEFFGWIDCEMTGWQSFKDDCRRYGLRVALYNLWWIVRHG